MKHFSKEETCRALLPHGTPMFGDLLAWVADDATLSAVRKRDLVSALRRVAKALGKDPSNVPAESAWLQPRLDAISPAAAGVSQKTWANLVSNTRAALAHYGIVRKRANRQYVLQPCWQPLMEKARECTSVHDSISRFIYFLDWLNISPEVVCDQHVTVFHDALVSDEIRKNPKASVRNAVNTWNRCVKHIPEWPQTRLQQLEPETKRIKFPIEVYPSSFAADLARFKDRMAHTNFLDDPDYRPLAPESIFTYARLLERFAGAVVRSGVAMDRITDIEALLADDMIETGLRWYYSRIGGEMTPGLCQMILALQQVGRRYLDRQDQLCLDKYAKRLPRKQQGMTEQNRRRLQPMLAPQMRTRIVDLPHRLMTEAGDQTSQTACLMREQAIALELLLYCPMRRGNLTSIDLDRHLVRPGDGQVFLVFPKSEVKNHVRLEFALPKRVGAMIDRHLALRSPRLCPPGTPFLFPKRDGSAPMAGGHLASNFKKCLDRELGLEVNLHLFRHFAAHLLLEACPGNYEGARRLLGHARLSSTLNAYTGIESTTVARQYAEIIAELQR